MEGERIIVSTWSQQRSRRGRLITKWLGLLIGPLILWAAVQTAGTHDKQAAEASSLSLSSSHSILAAHLDLLSVAADLDLCTLLPSGAGWYTRPFSIPTTDCIASRNGTGGPYPNVTYAEISKLGSSDLARQQVQSRHDTLSSAAFNVTATTDFGDPGYAYNAVRSGSIPAGFFARSCYYVDVIGSMPPASTGDMHNLLVSIDTALKQAPCGGGGGAATPTPAPPTGPKWVIRVAKVENAQWFGNTPPTVKLPDGTTVQLAEGQVLTQTPDDLTLISTNGYRVEMAWTDGNVTRTVKLGPDTNAQVKMVAATAQDPIPTNRVGVLQGLAEFILPKPEKESDYKFQASTRTVVLAVKGTTFDLSYDAKSDASTIGLQEGVLEVAPTNSSLQGIELQSGQQVTVGASSVSPVTPYVAIPGNPGYVFPETGKVATGIFMDYWQTHGSLAQQGYPVSGLMQEVSDLNGKTYTVQYFERAVFEYHPEFTPPNDVLLSQLGTFQYRRKYPAGAPNQRTNQTNGHFFQETGHWVGGTFWDYWQKHGGLAQQGYPISDEFTEVSETDGKPYTVQYFERAVFEQHPEFAPPNNVLLSLLGNFFYNQKYGSGAGGGGSGGSGGSGNAAQLLKNPGCEEVAAVNGKNKPASWTDTGGGDQAQWECVTAGRASLPQVHGGTLVFFPGQVVRGELQQDVNVSAFSGGIAAGKQVFQFSGWHISEGQDAPEFIVEYRDAANSKVLGTYDSGPVVNATWTQVVDKRNAPVGTGWIRVRLVGVRHEGTDNDAYFDDLVLSTFTSDTGGGGGGTTQPTATPVSGGGGGSGQCSNIPAPTNMTITPSNCAAAGNAFFFAGRGFQPGETVGVYATAPDGSVLGAPFQVTADQNGVTSGGGGVTLTTHTNTTPGIYALTMEGVTSHNKAIGYIRVLAP